MTLGYRLPARWVQKISLNSVRFYASGENLFTLTKFYKGWDPEMSVGGSSRWYPLTKLYVLGVNVEF
jgi:hypothetical protein